MEFTCAIQKTLMYVCMYVGNYRVPVLSYDIVCVILGLVVLVHLRLVTYRQTDAGRNNGRRDTWWQHCTSIARAKSDIYDCLVVIIIIIIIKYEIDDDIKILQGINTILNTIRWKEIKLLKNLEKGIITDDCLWNVCRLFKYVKKYFKTSTN